jgi:integrase
MANTSLSRNLFADSTLPTFAGLIDSIAADDKLPLRKRQNWTWALRAIARAAGKEPAAIPAHPTFLRSLLQQAAPASIGLSRAGWNNARSLMCKALEWAGLASMPGHYQAPFSPPWAELWSRLPPNTALAYELSRMFHYSSAQGIEPTGMNDAVLDQFHEALVEESIVQFPYEIYRGAAKSWNNAAERIPGWPQHRLTVPSRQEPVFCLPWASFPSALEADVEAYCRRAEGLDLSDDHFTRAQRPATIKTRRAQLRQLATAVHKSGVALEALVDLRAVLTPEWAAGGLKYLVERNGGASSVSISNIADFLPTLARRLDMSEEVITKLLRMKRKLKVSQHGMTQRNREALRAFDDDSAVQALLRLSRRILSEVLASGRKGYREAKLIQTALAVELLLNAPVRIQNLASIDLDRHFVEVGAGKARTVHLRFPAAEVKNANDLEFPLVEEAVELQEIYLADWRPLLMTGPSRCLFPGKAPGRSKGNGTLSSQIKELVYAYTRLDMPAHRFRQASARSSSTATRGSTKSFGSCSATRTSPRRSRSTRGPRAPALPATTRAPFSRSATPAQGRPVMSEPLSSVSDAARRCLPVAEWSAADRAAWAAAHRRGGLLDEDGLAANWAPATSSIIASGHGRFLSYLAESDGLDRAASPAARVTRQRVEAYVARLRERNHSSTVAARIAQLARAVGVMAPGDDWAWLRRMARRLRRSATPARDDRARLLPAMTLFELATALMERAEARTDVSARLRALWFRDGLMIAVLCVWAPRARNVSETIIGASIQRRGAVWWAAFGPSETKNGRPVEVPLPKELTQRIERYLDHYRPQLVSRSPTPVAGDAFWVSSGGRPLTAKEVGQRISAVTKRELGKALNPHLFRQIIPTELAIRDPEHVGIAHSLLGHADYRMTQKYYNLGRALDAAKRYQGVVASLRAGMASPQIANRGILKQSTDRVRGAVRVSRSSSRRKVG